MAKKFPMLPGHPERVCWGCDHYCAANDMRCGNGSDRTPHPMELFGERWREWGAQTDHGTKVEPVRDCVAQPTPHKRLTSASTGD